MDKECRHIKSNGLKCQSPAMRGSQFCYFHGRKRIYVARPSRDAQIELPPLDSLASVHAALNQVMIALAAGTITTKRAGVFLNAIQIARQTVCSLPFAPPSLKPPPPGPR